MSEPIFGAPQGLPHFITARQAVDALNTNDEEMISKVADLLVLEGETASAIRGRPHGSLLPRHLTSAGEARLIEAMKARRWRCFVERTDSFAVAVIEPKRRAELP